MNFRRVRRGVLPAIQLTTMMDVIFLLLFFFITTSVFSQWEYAVDITLPTAENAEMPERLPGEIIINIDKEGYVSINQQVLTVSVLKRRLTRLASAFPGQPVVIRADKTTHYEDLIKVVDACREADIWNFSMATNKGQEDKVQ